ncbi:MAG: PX domain-containing protein ypt35 [Thelocarpon impressellum]|nr:MAG: PX domain-containing protein ypt35 [Thelocarpon impressellum]
MESSDATATSKSNGHGGGGGEGATSPQQPITPPYWTHQRSASATSNASSQSVPASAAGAITLEDHTEEPSDASGALWARSVTIDECIVVSGSRTGVGAYVVYSCRVETLEGGPITIRKRCVLSSVELTLSSTAGPGLTAVVCRYSEFLSLRQKLLQTFPHSSAAMPDLPPKSAFWRTQPKFLEKRRVGLSYFLNCVLLNPEFSGAPVLKEFVFA